MFVALHTPEGIVADGEDVGRDLTDLPVGIPTDVVAVVDIQQFVGIDRDKNRTGESLERVRLERERDNQGDYIDMVFFVSHVKIVEDGRFFQITQ